VRSLALDCVASLLVLVRRPSSPSRGRERLHLPRQGRRLRPVRPVWRADRQPIRRHVRGWQRRRPDVTADGKESTGGYCPPSVHSSRTGTPPDGVPTDATAAPLPRETPARPRTRAQYRYRHRQHLHPSNHARCAAATSRCSVRYSCRLKSQSESSCELNWTFSHRHSVKNPVGSTLVASPLVS
jgi:hypothetical protein